MKKVSLIAFATSLFLVEVASAQLSFDLKLPGVGRVGVDLGGRRNPPPPGRRNPNQNPPPVRRDPIPRVDVELGNFKFRLGRQKHWQQNRVIWGSNAESAIEPGTKLIGYTMISDGDLDFDNVEIRNREFSDAIKVKVINDGARIDRLSIRFCEGGSESFNLGQRFFPGSSTGWMDLPGRSRCISSFSVSGQGDRDGLQATVVLLGREPVPQFNRRSHWNSHRENYQQMVRRALTGHTESGERLVGYAMLSENVFDFETVDVSHQENVDEVRLWVIGDNAFVDTLSIQFCNNFSNSEIFRFGHDIEQNGISPWMDLRGVNRCINKFAVSGKGSRGFGDSVVIVTGRNRPGNGGFSSFPQPQPLPSVPVGPACELLGYGYQNGNYWNYRVKVSGSVLHATDSLDSMIKSINDLAAAGVCSKQPSATILSGYTYYRSAYWQFTLKMNDSIVFASDDFNDTIQAMNKLIANDLAYPQANGRCQLMGPGSYRGYSWSNRVATGDSVVFGEDDLEDAIWFMSKIRQLRFCE